MKKLLIVAAVASFPVSVCYAYGMGVRDERRRVDSSIADVISKARDVGIRLERRRIVDIIKSLKSTSDESRK